jgi:hypothetical protein
MAVALPLEGRSWKERQWPMTREAWETLDADCTRLTAEVVANDGYITGRLDGETDAPTFIPNIVGQQLLHQLTGVREVLERSVVIDDPTLVVIGRRVTLEEADGGTSTYAVVIPGDGDPRNGFVSGDSPVGAALLGRRIGEAVTIEAPAGSWSATIVQIE